MYIHLSVRVQVKFMSRILCQYFKINGSLCWLFYYSLVSSCVLVIVNMTGRDRLPMRMRCESRLKKGSKFSKE